jgi:hypothetical protein
MKKFTSIFVKVSVFSALIAPVAFAAESVVSGSAWAEPIYLSLCGVILVVFGTMKNNAKEDTQA